MADGKVTDAKTPTTATGTLAYVVQAVGGLVVGIAAVTGAVALGETRIGSLPAAISPAGLLICIAAGAVAFALLVPWRRAHAKRDEAIARMPGVKVSVGAIVTADLKQELLKVAGVPVRQWPARVTFVGSTKGVELWAGPGMVCLLSIPWAEVERLRSGRLHSTGRAFSAVLIDLADGKSVGIPLASTGRMGFGNVLPEEVEALVVRLTELKSLANP
jgi:hypothetical protein